MAFHPILSCQEVLDLLGDDLEKTLPPGKSLQYRLHLFLCRHCRRYKQTYRTTVDLVRALREKGQVPDNQPLSDGLIQQIITQAKNETRPAE